MDKYLKKILLTVLIISYNLYLFAQNSAKPIEMADTMRSNGKIYVVVAVILTLFTGLIIYLISLDRKITKLEKESGKS
jgi:CcmD family protein